MQEPTYPRPLPTLSEVRARHSRLDIGPPRRRSRPVVALVVIACIALAVAAFLLSIANILVSWAGGNCG